MRVLARVLSVCFCIVLVLSSFGCMNKDERRLKELQRQIEKYDVVIEAQEEKIDKLERYKKKYDVLQDKLSRLTPGTSEYDEVVKENNELVRKMLRDFPELETYVKYR